MFIKKVFSFFFNQKAIWFFRSSFSDRYKYGWRSEKYRIKIHEEFIKFIKKKGKILFYRKKLPNFYFKNNIKINENKKTFTLLGKNYKNYIYKAIYKDKIYLINDGKKNK